MENKEAEVGSKKLSPAELKGKDFRKVLRGYDPREVAELLDQVAKAWEKSIREERSTLKKLNSATEELARWKAREDELAEMRQKAIQDADSIREEASKEASRMLQEIENRATTIRNSTEEWLEGVISRLEETQRQKTNFLTALRSSLDSHYELLQTESQEGNPGLGSELTAFLQGRLSSDAPSRH